MRVRVPTLCALLAGAALLSEGRVALATEQASSPLDPGYIVELQMGAGTQPTYPGARYYRPVPVPGISVRRTDEPVRFSSPDDGFGVPILDAQGFRLGPVGNVVVPRWRTHEELHGLHKVRPAIEAGVFVEYFPIEMWRARLEIRHGVYGHDGLVARAGTDFVAKAGPVTWSLGPRVDFGSQAFSRAYYGVKPYEALANGTVPAFSPQSGITSAGLLSTARTELDANWNATAYGGMQRLTGSAAASPIPRLLGSRNQFSAGLLFARSITITP